MNAAECFLGFLMLGMLVEVPLATSAEPPATAPAPREVTSQDPDSTAMRKLRWMLWFKVADGTDYVNQLKALNAKLLFPVPQKEKCILVADLTKPSEQKIVDPTDYLDQFVFVDSRAEAVKGVIETLGLDLKSTSFAAVFPRELEMKLAKMEHSYRNRRVEDLEETIFQVILREGEVEVTVYDQCRRKP